MKVISFQPTANSNAIAGLEEILAEVKAGRIKAIAVAGVNHDGGITRFFSHNGEFFALTGAVAVLFNRLLNSPEDR